MSSYCCISEEWPSWAKSRCPYQLHLDPSQERGIREGPPERKHPFPPSRPHQRKGNLENVTMRYPVKTLLDGAGQSRQQGIMNSLSRIFLQGIPDEARHWVIQAGNHLSLTKSVVSGLRWLHPQKVWLSASSMLVVGCSPARWLGAPASAPPTPCGLISILHDLPVGS